MVILINLDTFICIAEVALSDMFGYATELRGLTQGIGEFSMEYKNHKPCQPHDTEKIIQNFQRQAAAKTATVKKGGSSFDI
jgi:elongation factor G